MEKAEEHSFNMMWFAYFPPSPRPIMATKVVQYFDKNTNCERVDNLVSYSTTNNALGLPKVLHDALGLPLHMVGCIRGIP